MIKFFDMFSGIGGFRAGLERVGGFECIGHCEIDKFADKSYRSLYNTEGEVYVNDATKINPEDLPDFDLLCAGFPCQSFSIAGKRRGFEDARGTLFFEIARVLRAKHPKYFLLENVPGLLNHDKGRTFTVILSTLWELGYDVEWQVLNSADFFVPQSRKRVYAFGFLNPKCTGKIFPFNECNPQTTKKIIDGSQGNRTYCPKGLSITLSANSGGQGGKTGIYCVTCIDLNEDADITTLARCVKSRYNSGITNHRGENSGILECVMPCLTPDRLDKRQNGPRFRSDGMPMYTMTASEIHGIFDGIRVRRLMPIECLLLQGFKMEQAKQLTLVNSDNQLYKQAGNAVTVTVVEAVGERIKEIDEDIKQGLWD